jgi:hypothetical protein
MDCHTHVIDLFQVKTELQDVMLTYRVAGVCKPCFEALSREITVTGTQSETTHESAPPAV